MKIFFDRRHAGKQLAQQLSEYRGSDAVVLAIPRGGVVVGHELATRLGLPLDIVITKKIAHPCDPTVAVCALAEDGARVCDDGGLYGLDDEWIQHELVLAQREAVRARYSFGAFFPQSITGKTVLLTDDGVATGLSMKAALVSLRANQPRRIVLAIPIGPLAVLAELALLVDEIVVLSADRSYRGVVRAYYADFPEVSDDEVAMCLMDSAVEPRLPVSNILSP